MRVRIIFRGLVLFRFETPQGGNHEELSAWLVSDPKHTSAASGTHSHMSSDPPHGAQPEAHGGVHAHRPHIAIYGRNADTGVEFKEVGIPLEPGETRLELMGHGTPNGVSATPGFREYVPSLQKLKRETPEDPKLDYRQSWITIPHGMIRARDLVSWDSDGNPPAAVAFMGTKYRGFVANEAVVDVGDDLDYDFNEPTKFLSVESTTELPRRLWALSKGTDYRDEVPPNVVEILVTNFSLQRRRGVFWSLDFQWLFDAAGYVRNSGYQSSRQYQKFEDAANAYDDYEWANDTKQLGIGQPFPFVIPGELKRLSALREELEETVINGPPPDPQGRGKHDGRPGKLVTHDPWARPICPLGQW